MWEMVELREIRIYLTLADELHFGRTAERLGLTQSRVSQSLRELETKLGGRLVERSSRRVTLTPLGEQFRDQVGDAHEQLAAVLERTEAANRELRSTIRVGIYSAPAGGPRFFDIVKAFEARHPGCAVKAEDGFPDLFGPLRRGEVDLVAGWLPHGQADVVVGPSLARERRVLAVGPEHRLAKRSKVFLEDVADYEVIEIAGIPEELHETWIPKAAPSGRPIRRQRLGHVSVNELSYLVTAGKVVHPTVTSVADSWGHPDLVYLPIADMAPMRSALMWRRGLRDPTLRRFIDVAREVLAPRRRTAGDRRHRPHRIQ